MTHRNHQPSDERRQHARFPVVDGLIEPVTLQIESQPTSKSQPAILTNLSAGGMSLVMFMEPPHAKTFDLVLTLPGLDHLPVEGKVIRVCEKGQTYNVGITFTKISKKHQNLINQMARDHEDCETRISLKLPEACVPTCSFNALCLKAQKDASFFGSAKGAHKTA